MKQLVVLLACVAMAMASKCGPLQQLKVKQQWREAYGTGMQRIELGKALFRTYFNIDPSAARYFSDVHGDDLESHEFLAFSAHSLSQLDICFNLLDDEPVFRAQAHHLHEDHHPYPRNHRELLEEALLDVIPSKLGRCFDREAWQACYGYIADGVQHG